MFHADKKKECPNCGGRRSDCRYNDDGIFFCWGDLNPSLPIGWKFIRIASIGSKMFGRDDREHDYQRFMSAEFRQKAKRLAEERKARKKAERAAKLAAAGTNDDNIDVVDIDLTAFPVSATPTAEERKSSKPSPSTKQHTESFQFLVQHKFPATDEWIAEFATTMGLPTDVFRLLDAEAVRKSRVGRDRPSITVPIRLPDLTIVGYSRRRFDGEKRTNGDGDGLFIPSGWSTRAAHPLAPIYVPAGASDVLALCAMSLNAVGRINDTVGTRHIPELLRLNAIDQRRPIIIAAENDEREKDGVRAWPGRDDAFKAAHKLVALLAESSIANPVYVALPPPGYKDVRAFFKANDHLTAAERGEMLDGWLREHAVKVEVGAVDPATVSVTTITTAPAVAAAAPSTPSTIEPLPVGSRACDYSPPPCPAPTPIICPYQKRHLMRRDATNETRIMFHDCRRLDCPVCGPKNRQQKLATVHHHLEQHAECGYTTVHVFHVAHDDWEAVAASMRRARINYFRVNPADGFLNYFVLASHKPSSTKIHGHEELPIDVGRSRISSLIVNMHELSAKWFSTSRGWHLIGDERRGKWQGWRRVCGLATSVPSILRVLEHHGLTDKVKIHVHPGQFWERKSWTWEDGRSIWQDVCDDLCAGEVISNIQIDWEAAFAGPIMAGAPPDAPTYTTGPPDW